MRAGEKERERRKEGQTREGLRGRGWGEQEGERVRRGWVQGGV